MQNAARRCGKATLAFPRGVFLVSSATVGGPLEGEGKLADKLDHVYQDPYAGQSSWEKAEQEMLNTAVRLALAKGQCKPEEVDAYLAGDLLNQIITASFSAKACGIPFLGMYGACSTAMLTLATASMMVDAGYARLALAATSSHRCTAERQYRYPTEYGFQRPATAQCTVTGAGAALVGPAGAGPRVTHATLGRVVDYEIKSPMHMGAAMAPAAVDTLLRHFADTGRQPQDYDLIATGDLALYGFQLAQALLAEQQVVMGDRFTDCGLRIYTEEQDVFAGGSGCACSALVGYAEILPLMRERGHKRVLLVGTGALLSPLSFQQGENIPAVAHAVAIEQP